MGAKDDSSERVDGIVSCYETSEYSVKVKEVINSLEEGDGKKLVSNINWGNRSFRYNVGFLEQFKACYIRSAKTSFRNPIQTKVNFIMTIFMALFVGLVYIR